MEITERRISITVSVVSHDKLDLPDSSLIDDMIIRGLKDECPGMSIKVDSEQKDIVLTGKEN